MGSTMSNNNNKQDDADSTSDEEPDFNYIRAKLKPAPRRMNCELDAVTTREDTPTLSRPIPEFANIDALLSNYERISLIYLLIDNPNEALERMQDVEMTNNFRLPIAFNLDNDKNREKLIEALCIIQNYEILNKVLGIRKIDVMDRYLPLQRCTALKINKTKKCLYRLFEDMSNSDSELFLQVVKKELKGQFKTFPYLEMHFSYLETIGFVTPNNFEKIEKAMMSIEREAHFEDLQSISNLRLGSRHINLDQGQSTPGQNEAIDFNTIPGNRKTPSLSSYDINPNSPGIVVIIENEFFYTECDEELENQLGSPAFSKISDRTGSRYDSIRLDKTFKKFKFEIEHGKNLTHNEMLQFVQKVAHVKFQEHHSCLYICLLSHGIEGKIIASNSIPVTINDIKSQLHSPNLRGKPKILIIQSCRGEEIQTLTTDSPSSQTENILVTDAPPKYTPPTVDFLEIWSTVPGYASIRDPYKGTWFIQSLCDVIDNSHSGTNIHEICTKTRERLLEMEWPVTHGKKTEIRVMVCETRDTLRKLLYLPSVQEI